MIFSTLLWLKTRIYWIAGVLAMVVAAVLSIRQSGKKSVESEIMKDTLKALKKKDEVEHEVASNPDGDAAKRLRDSWSRD